MNIEDVKWYNKLMRILQSIGFKVSVLMFIVLIAFLFSKNFSILFIQGDSMYPTYNNGEVVLIKKKREIKNGDISVFYPNSSWSDNKGAFIKRVIASEDDVVFMGDGVLSVNNVVIKEVDLANCSLWGNETIKISKGSFFVMGDNYSSSNDSLSQYCNNNSDFLVSDKQMMFSGSEVFKMKGVLN